MGFDDLWDGFDKVNEKGENGEKFYKDYLKYLKKRNEIEKEYAKKLKELIDRFKTENEIGTLQQSWIFIKDETNSIADNRVQFSENIEKIIEKLTNTMKEEKKERALLVARGTRLVKDLKSAEEDVKKTKKEYEGSLSKQNKAKELLDKEKQKGGSSVAKMQKSLESNEKKNG